MTPPADATATGLKEAIARTLYLRRHPSNYSCNDSYQWSLAKSGGYPDVQKCYDDATAILALLPSASVGGEREAEDDPCAIGGHCCCCGPHEPCCDCGSIMPSKSCTGEQCWCGKPAAKKIGEEIPFDDPSPHRHNLTAYVCAQHYALIMGSLGAKQVGIAAPETPPTEGEKS